MDWISINDRHPENGEKVLMTDGKRQCVAYSSLSFNTLEYSNCCGCNCGCVFSNMTHWMHLPMLPIKDGD